jgi:hypothetical protein
MRRRTAAVLGSVALCSIVLAGCSGGSSGGDSGGATGAAKTGAGSTTSPTTAVNASALVSGASHATSKLKSAHIKTVTELGGKTTNFSGTIAYHPTQLDFQVDVAGQQLRELLVDDTFYIKLPAAAGAGTKPWVSVPIKQISKLSGIDLDSLLNNANADQTVTLLAKSGDLKLVGNETVNGVSTRHLSGTVDISKYFSALGAVEKTKQKTLQAMVQQLGVKDSHIDLWVNGDDVPVKTVQTYTSKMGAGKSTMELTDINAPVHIKAPAASLVQRYPG